MKRVVLAVVMILSVIGVGARPSRVAAQDQRCSAGEFEYSYGYGSTIEFAIGNACVTADQACYPNGVPGPCQVVSTGGTSGNYWAFVKLCCFTAFP
jgi:hypothetical protein